MEGDDYTGNPGINGLSPSSDTVITDLNQPYFSPIGFPVHSHGSQDYENSAQMPYPRDTLQRSFLTETVAFQTQRDEISPHFKQAGFPTISHPVETLSPKHDTVSVPFNQSPPSSLYNTPSFNPYSGQTSFLPPLRSNFQERTVRHRSLTHQPLNYFTNKGMSFQDGLKNEEWIGKFNDMSINQSYGNISKESRETGRSRLRSHSDSTISQDIPSHQRQRRHTLGSGHRRYISSSLYSSHKYLSRIICVYNSNSFSKKALLSHFEKFGEIRSTSSVNDTLLIFFYDIRHSQTAMQNSNGKYLNDTPLDMSYCFQREFNSVEESNQGTLVVFNLDPRISIRELSRIFSEYGEIREIRESPNKKHKFVEFYDIREAANAMKHLNKTEIEGKRIKIEPSRPGGNRNNDSNQRRGSVPKNIARKRVDERTGEDGRQTDFNSLSMEQDSSENISNDQYNIHIKNIASNSDRRTTLMIKNIPNKYNQEMLLEAIDINHAGQYDFLYLPIDFKNKCNVGYAFINFKDHTYIPDFYFKFNSKKWLKFNSEKVCQISYARIQGRDAMVEHFKNSSLLYEDKKCQPLIFQSNEKGRLESLTIGINEN